jgi:hypothetical protein
MYFFVKVKINESKLLGFGKKLQSGEITTHPLFTYCLQEDPSIGLNIWEAKDREDFDTMFDLHREFYSKIIEITPVITPQKSMEILMSRKE